MDNINLFLFLLVFIYGLFLNLIFGVVGHISTKLELLITKKHKKISEGNAYIIAFMIVFTPVFCFYFMGPFLPIALDLFHFKDPKDGFIFGLTFFLGMSTSTNMVKLKKKMKGN